MYRRVCTLSSGNFRMLDMLIFPHENEHRTFQMWVCLMPLIPAHGGYNMHSYHMHAHAHIYFKIDWETLDLSNLPDKNLTYTSSLKQ